MGGHYVYSYFEKTNGITELLLKLSDLPEAKAAEFCGHQLEHKLLILI